MDAEQRARDQRWYAKCAAQKTATEARELGIKEGLVRCIHLCQRVLNLPHASREELLALPLEELNGKAKELEQELGVA